MLLVRYMEHGVDEIQDLADEDEDKEGTVGDVLNGRDRVRLDATYTSELYNVFLEDLKEQGWWCRRHIFCRCSGKNTRYLI